MQEMECGQPDNGEAKYCVLARCNICIFLLAVYVIEDMFIISHEVVNAQQWIAAVYVTHDIDAPSPN